MTLIETCEKISPHNKIMLSEIIPRMDILDRDVFKVNKLIDKTIANSKMITIVEHHSLRKSTLMKDNKHVAEVERTLTHVNLACGRVFVRF